MLGRGVRRSIVNSREAPTAAPKRRLATSVAQFGQFAVAMITLAFEILCVAAVLGAALALVYLRGPVARAPHWAVPVLHGGFGATGLALLVAALVRGLPRTAMGTAGFGRTAAGLLSLALTLGLAIVGAAWRRRRPNGALLGAHIGFAVAGLVVLSALLALG
jgi:hypothetical protein